MTLRHYNPSSLWFIVQEGAERDCCWRSETQWDSPCHSRGSASLSAKPSCHPQVLQQLPGERRLLHHHWVLWGKSSFGNTWVSFFRSFLVIISLKKVTWSGPVNCWPAVVTFWANVLLCPWKTLWGGNTICRHSKWKWVIESPSILRALKCWF